jgi:hypothetical protein
MPKKSQTKSTMTKPTAKKPPPSTTNQYSPLIDDSSQSKSPNLLEDDKSLESTGSKCTKPIPLKSHNTDNMNDTTTPSTTNTRGRRAAANGLKTFPGTPTQEQKTLYTSMVEILNATKRHPMRKYINNNRLSTLRNKLEKIKDDYDALKMFAQEIITSDMVTMTSKTPLQLKYHPEFLEEFYDKNDYSTIYAGKPTNNEDKEEDADEDDDEITILPTPIDPKPSNTQNIETPPRNMITPQKPVWNPYQTPKRGTQLTLTQIMG